MSFASGPHEITPEFRARLAWQIESALRRETRFAAPVDRRMPRLGMVVSLLAAIAIGGIAVAASGELQEARQRDALLESAKSEQAVLHLRLGLARTDYEEARRRFETGTAPREAREAAETQVRAIEADIARVQLDIAEIEASSAAPRNDLQAPLVGQRDFVRERLLLELKMAQDAVASATRAAAKTRERVAVGIAPRTAQLQAELELAEADARIRLLMGRLQLRENTLANQIKPEEVAAAARELELKLRMEQLQHQLQIARERVQEMRSLVEVGRTSQLDLKRAEVELLEREIELQQVRRELEMVSRR
jgi:outer membrane protein TolC